jgi:hypothetical protein
MVWGEGGDNDNITLLCPEFFAAHVVRALSGLSPKREEWDIFRDIWNAMQAMQENIRMLSFGLQETSGNPKGSLSRRQNGQNTMDYCVSGTASMF